MRISLPTLISFFLIFLVLNVTAVTSVTFQNASTITNATGKWFDYVVMIMMENHSINDTYDNGLHSCVGNCTYATLLANSNGLAEGYTNTGVIGGSAGDYIAITSGYGNESTACNNGPMGASGCILTIPNIVDRIENVHLTWKAYMEGYPVPFGCYNFRQNSPYSYSPNHNPFVYYADIQNSSTRCSRIVNANSIATPQNSTGCWPSTLENDNTLLSDLGSVSTASNYMWLTPNSVDDDHDCTTNNISIGDAWLNGIVPQIFGSVVFRTQRAALFITFDEPGCTFSGCPPSAPQLYTVWTSNPSNPVTLAGFKSTNTYTHFSALRTIEDNWGLAPLIASTDGRTNSMGEFF
jgi:hypothetical protein